MMHSYLRFHTLRTMAAPAAFQAALNRLGFNQESVEALVANGLTRTEDLCSLEDNDVEQLLKIIRTGPPARVVPFLAQKRLITFCFWAKRRSRLGESIAANLFTPQALEAYTTMMTLTSKEDDTGIKSPGEFKKDTKWKTFKEGLIAYLNGLKGKHNIPLAYVIREDAAPQVNQAFQTEHHRLIAITPLAGVEYDEDNGRVFDILKSLLINGPAWTWMRSYNNTRNGRQAWISLINHFEGDAQRDRVKDHAYSAIAAAKYYGDRKKFSFETYVAIHQDAYADLEQYGEIVLQEKRVRDLLVGIKDNSPAANAAKGTILATPNLRTSFENAVAHLATTLQLNQSYQDSRNISSINTSNDIRGQGRGRGRGRGRGGRGGRNIYLGSYSPDAWRKLSADDKKKVIEGREKSAQQQSQQGSTHGSRGGRGGRGGRNKSTANTVPQDEPSAITGLTMAQDLDQSILQGTLQGSSAVGEKRSMADTAGSQMSRRHRINKVVTSCRTTKMHNISQVQQHPRYYELSSTVQGPCELDTHADTCVAGANCIILEESNQTVNVSAFTDTHEPLINIPIVTAATAYDEESTGTTYILILGQAIYLGNQMKNSFICPNQLRANGLIVEDCPKHLAPRDNPSSHSIFAPEDNLMIPLQLRGVTSYFTTRTPTINEVETCQWIYLSSDQDWDPHSEVYQQQEKNYDDLMTRSDFQDRQIHCTKVSTQISNTVMKSVSRVFDDRHIICATNTSRRDMNTKAETIAKNWSIGLENAKKTIQCTTQKGIRNTLYPIERRFRTKQAQLRYSQLSGRHGRFYTDTFFASVPSLNGCKMAQIFINDLNFSKVYPMQAKSETSDTLKAFIHDVGIPHTLHSDDAKELMQGAFKQVCKDYNIPCTYTEPYSPWQNRAEGGIRELKRHVHRKMTSKKVPQ